MGNTDDQVGVTGDILHVGVLGRTVLSRDSIKSQQQTHQLQNFNNHCCAVKEMQNNWKLELDPAPAIQHFNIIIQFHDVRAQRLVMTTDYRFSFLS